MSLLNRRHTGVILRLYLEISMFEKIGPSVSRARAAVVGAALSVAAAAHAADPATAQEALGTLSTSNTGYGPVLWGMAAAAVGIMIGIKWIKRGRGAA
ncbi:hypothetical protein C8E08_0880 [Paracidovorax citrulli]|nr:major coat protein [Paracidovorax citrulli]PVY63589.1 hypothetical protein C8E08_0880 [Paracidovorax citrulli]REG67445.1 hypothetical protein C8E07_0507 [Paracidovorax citrulli]RLJ92005.1 hypothetical protein C8E06_0508 [Paracidovorax citrulli]